MDKLDIKQGSFIQQTQYFIPVEIDLSVVSALLGISDFFHLSRRTTVIQDILVRRQFSLVPDNRTNVNVKACRHELWKDYKNSEYTGNRNFTKTRNGPERKFWK